MLSSLRIYGYASTEIIFMYINFGIYKPVLLPKLMLMRQKLNKGYSCGLSLTTEDII